MGCGALLKCIPFVEAFLSEKDIQYLSSLSNKQLLLQAINASYTMIWAYMIWKASGAVFNTESPFVVVLSESMSPGFERGDILFLTNWKKHVDVGDVCVFRMQGKEIPIVHRAIRKTHPPAKGALGPGAAEIVTKGDHNRVDDHFLYSQVGKKFLREKEILAHVHASFPLLGMITIWCTAYPILKYSLILVLFCDVLLTRETSPSDMKFGED